MSETPPDFNALARRYLDLWQEQVAAVAADPALAETVARGVAMMTQSAAAMATATNLKGVKTAPVGDEPGSDERTASRNSPPQHGTDGSSPPAVAPDDSRLHHDELTRRVAALEERIAKLEAALGGGGLGSAPKPGKRRG